MSTVVIIGGGIIGLTTAYALAERGIQDVTIVERDTVASGGTGKSAGIIRSHYGVSSIAALAQRSLRFFEHATELLGVDIGFEQVGYLVGVGEENLVPFRASLANQQALGVQTSEIDAGAVAALWPTAYLDDFATFCFEPRGGYGDGYATAQALAAHLRARGVSIKQGAPVEEILATGTKVTGIRTVTGEVLPAEKVVVAAGAWSVPLLRPLGVELPIKPLMVQEVMIDPGTNLGAPPVFSDLVSMQYVHLRKGEMLFGNSSGGDALQLVADPDVYPHHAANETIELVAEKALHRFPGIEEPRVSGSATGIIDATPDRNPIVSGTPYDGLVVAAGMSGHGFKISPALGELTADILLGRNSSIANVKTEDFRLSRFEEGKPLVSSYPYQGAEGIR